MKTFTCQMCGREFESQANRASFCPECRIERQKMRSRAYTKKLHGIGERRIIGSTDICPMCGKPYIVKSGSQKVCEDCRRSYRNKQKQKPNNDYTSKAYDMFSVFVKKGEKDGIKDFAKKHGMSANELFNLGLSLAMEKLSRESSEEE